MLKMGVLKFQRCKNDIIFPDYSIHKNIAVFENKVKLQEFPLNYWDVF